MEQIRRENPMIFNRGLAITRKLGFPDVIMPGRQNFLGLRWEKGRERRCPVLISGAGGKLLWRAPAAIKSPCTPSHAADRSAQLVASSALGGSCSFPEALTSHS